MIVAVFSDVHANLPALETFVAHTKTDVEMYICLGDIVNYGPWNDECLGMISNLPNIIILEGNHERLFRGDDPIDHELDLVRQFYAHSRKRFTRWDLISDLPSEYRIGPYLCTHTIDDQRVYPDTQIKISQNYIIGHTHHAFIKKISGYTLINCGSIGQNRSKINSISYAIMNTDSFDVSLHTHPYNFDRFIDTLRKMDYPKSCIDYYLNKKKAQVV